MKPGEQKDIAIPFGKHKGKLIADLPMDYLNWLMDQDWFVRDYPEHIKQVRIEWQYRKKFGIKE